MHLTVLGCSGSVPGPGVPCSGYLVEHDGYRLLLDLGTGAFGALLEWLRPSDVDAVVISHRHADHLADLAALAYAQHKMSPRPTPTRVLAPAGVARRVRRHALFDWMTACSGDVRYGPFRLRLARVRHSVETYAVRVEAGGGVLVYTGDSGPCGELVALARDADVLLAESALGPGEGTPGVDEAVPDAEGTAGWQHTHDAPAPHHLTARQAGELATLTGAGVLVVTHLRPWEDAGRSLAAAADRFAGPVVLARPGLRLAPARSRARGHSATCSRGER